MSTEGTKRFESTEQIVESLRQKRDLSGALNSLMGWRQSGVRVTVQVPDEKGRLAKVATAIADAGGPLVGGGSYPAAEAHSQRRWSY